MAGIVDRVNRRRRMRRLAEELPDVAAELDAARAEAEALRAEQAALHAQVCDFLAEFAGIVAQGRPVSPCVELVIEKARAAQRRSA
jgi:hypothetical protein